jgi:hypothetical protein
MPLYGFSNNFHTKSQNIIGRVPGSGTRHIRLTSSELLEEEVEEPREQRIARKDCAK